MPIPIASRSWLFVALLAASGAVATTLYLDDDDDPSWCEEQLEMASAMEPRFHFMGIVTDRASRWLVDHPDRVCPRGDEIATTRELVEHNFRNLSFVCGDGQYRRVLSVEVRDLVHWPALPSD